MTVRRYVVLALVLAATASNAAGQRVIPDERSCDACRVQLVRSLTLGTMDGVGALPGTPKAATVDGSGRIWTTFYASAYNPILFNSDGRPSRVVGRRGQGPGEFRSAEVAIPLPGDSVLIIDSGNGSSTVFDGSLRPIRHIRIPGAYVRHAVPYRWPLIAVSTVIRTERSFGWPLHVYDMSGSEARVSASFGHNGGAFRTVDHGMLYSVFAYSPSGEIWTVDELQYRITHWSPTGSPLEVLLRQPEWFPSRSTGLDGGRSTPPDPRIVAASFDGDGLLWVFSWVTAADYAEQWRKYARGGRTTSSGRAEAGASALPNSEERYDTLIEVLDIKSGRVVATAKTPIHVIGALTDGRIVSTTINENGVQTIGIWQKRIAR